MQDTLNEAESQIARLEVGRKGLEGDQQRMQIALDEKESEIKVRANSSVMGAASNISIPPFQALKSKCDGLTRGVTRLEDKCSGLSATVDGLNSQLDRSAQNEGELQVRVDELSRSLHATSSNSNSVHEQLSQLQRALAGTEAEKEVFGHFCFLFLRCLFRSPTECHSSHFYITVYYVLRNRCWLALQFCRS